MTNYPLNDGDVIHFRTGGGGGYGNPPERDIDAVVADAVDGYLSPAKAREKYGVIMDGSGISAVGG